MSRRLVFAALFASCACAAILPDQLGQYQRKSDNPVQPPSDSRPILDEDGFVAAEQADYGPFRITAWQFKDPTGAYAGSLDPLRKGVRIGNYLVSCEGECPKDLESLADHRLPHVSHGAIPNLSAYFTAKGLLAHSERYILGPVSLMAAVPQIPAAALHFDYGTEGQVARYRTSGGAVTLGVFSFPTPSMARQQLPQFQQITGAVVKRTGPLLAIAIGPQSASSKLLNSITYQGTVEADQEPPATKPLEIQPETAGQMILTILSLAGLLLAFCLLSGLAVGGTLRLARRFGYSAAEGSLITLHLEGK